MNLKGNSPEMPDNPTVDQLNSPEMEANRMKGMIEALKNDPTSKVSINGLGHLPALRLALKDTYHIMAYNLMNVDMPMEGKGALIEGVRTAFADQKHFPRIIVQRKHVLPGEATDMVTRASITRQKQGGKAESETLKSALSAFQSGHTSISIGR